LPKRDLVKRIDLNNNGLFGNGNLTASRTPPKYWGTVVVAAYNSSPEGRAGADYVCDGVADDVTISLAIAAGGNAPKRVVLLEGTYTIIAGMTILANSSIEGQGANTIVKIADSGAASTLTVFTLGDQSKVTNLKIDGNGVANTKTGIFADTKTGVEVTGVLVNDFNTYGIALDACTSARIIGNRATDCNSMGIRSRGGSSNVIVGNTCYGNQFGIYLGYTGGEEMHTTVAGNTCKRNTYDIYLANAFYNTVTGNTCAGIVGDLGDYGIFLDSGNYNVISDNTISAHSGAGVYVSFADHNVICDNYIIGNSWSTSTSTGINASSGIELDESDRNFIHGNKIIKSLDGASEIQQYSIRVYGATCNDNVIIDNDLRLGGHTGYLNAGTGTVYTAHDGSTPQRTLTLASDIVTVSGSGYYTILPQSGTADDMVTINGFSDGMILYIRAETAAHVITVKETGNIDLVGGNFAMTGRSDFLVLIYDEDQAKWMELTRRATSSGGSTYELTIASGAVTAGLDYHTLKPETGAVDDLTTINGGTAGQVLILQPGATYTVTLKDGTGNLDLDGDYVMVDTDDGIIILAYNSTTSMWIELYRSGTADIADGYVTFAKFQDINGDRLLGRDTSGTGPIVEISLNSTLEFTGGNAIQRAALTGDVTASAGSNTTVIPNDQVSNAKLANMADSTIKGRAAGAGSGDPTDLTAAQVLTILGVSSSLHVFTSFTANTAGGADTTLDSYTVPAGKLVADGDTLWFEAFGTFASNGNSKTLKVNFGSSGTYAIFTQSSTLSAVDWEIKGRIMRLSGTSQQASVSLIAGTSVAANYTSGLDQTLSGTVAFSIVGASSGRGDIILQGVVIGYTAAP
jgi:parallel beta-helix repeat protein